MKRFMRCLCTHCGESSIQTAFHTHESLPWELLRLVISEAVVVNDWNSLELGEPAEGRNAAGRLDFERVP